MHEQAATTKVETTLTTKTKILTGPCSVMDVTLADLERLMKDQIQRLGGQEKAIESCDRMYSALFRTEAMPISDIEDWQDEETTMKMELATKLYILETGYQMPVEPDDFEDDHDADSYYASIESFENGAEEWFDKKYPEFEITEDTMVVQFCNYKGEGESGIGFYSLYKDCPIFTSKRNSFNAVNS
jgi:hypothetical protein